MRTVKCNRNIYKHIDLRLGIVRYYNFVLPYEVEDFVQVA